VTRHRFVSGPRLLAAGAAAAAVLLLAAGAAGAAEEAVRATLKARAVLPAATLVPPPADAPAALNVAGRFAGPGGRRIDLVGSVEGVSNADPRGPRGTGIFLPVAGQPVQGFSGVRRLGGDEFLVVTDNGFGSRANSPDALLMFHRLRADWGAGRLRRLETTFLRDPDGLIPFRIALEATRERHLTGADLDTESVQPVGDLVWIGDEFGPYLVAAERATGRVVHFAETEVDGKVVRSPDHHAVGTPATPGPVRFEVRRSRGFEGMAQSPDGRFLYPLLEAPLFVGDPLAPERVDGREVLRILEFDVQARRWTGRGWKYPLEADGNNIGDLNMVDAARALVIERDNNEGDPRLACRGETRPDCFGQPAAFKRVYLIDLGRADANGVVGKLGYVDLLDIADPDGVARAGTIDGRFTFPFQTIEGVDVVDATTIVVGNDNNFPYSNGRTPGAADDNELVLLEVGELLGRR
jgi:hypothetical protein